MRWSDRIGRRIKLSDLHILLAVAQNGSMAKAASELAVSHPVVSRSISDLEHALGVRLLERNSRGVELTESGRAILNRSHAAFDELRQGVKDVEFLADPTAGEVRIGTSPPLAASFVSAVIDRLSRRHPRIVNSGRTRDRLGASTAAQPERTPGRSFDLPKICLPCRPPAGLRKALRKPLSGGGGYRESVGETAPHRACGFDGRTVGAAADRRFVRSVRPGSLSCRWTRLPACHRACRCPRFEDQSPANRPLSFYSPGVPIAISDRASVHPEIAGRITDCQRTDRDHRAEEPHAEPGGAELYRLRPRGREAIGNEETISRTSAAGPPHVCCWP